MYYSNITKMFTSENDNFVKMFERSFRNNWNLEAISDYGTPNTLTYGQVATNIARLHHLFRACGIQKDDRIAVMGRNNCNWVTTYLATVTYGAVIVPILQDFKANDAMHLLHHSESKLFFVTDLIWEGMELDELENVQAVYSLADFHLIATRIEKPETITFEAASAALNRRYPKGFSADDVRYDERKNECMASINYTSGTTGFSKGVMTTCNALASHLKYFVGTKLVFQGCRHVAFLPLAHAYGCIVDFLGAMVAGGHTHFIGRTPSPKILLQAFKEVKPTLIISVPLILEKIYRKQIAPQISKAPISWVLKVPYLEDVVLNKIRQQLIDAFGGEFNQIILGGAPLNAEVEAFLRRIKFPLSVGYGMTECAPIISWTSYPDVRPYSCGKLWEGYMEARIDEPNGEGIGEIQVRGEHTMLGYYKNEEATRESFTEDGWLRTGDLGYIDEDGYLYIKGRNKTMLLGPNGQNIYPEEIEAKLNNMPYVLESLVIQNDNRLVALVCPDYDAVDANGLDKDSLEQVMENVRRDLNEQLANYEQINKIKLYPHEFEKTPKRSIKRFLYTSMAQ